MYCYYYHTKYKICERIYKGDFERCQKQFEDFWKACIKQ